MSVQQKIQDYNKFFGKKQPLKPSQSSGSLVGSQGEQIFLENGMPVVKIDDKLVPLSDTQLEAAVHLGQLRRANRRSVEITSQRQPLSKRFTSEEIVHSPHN